jgi:hypothetical protein
MATERPAAKQATEGEPTSIDCSVFENSLRCVLRTRWHEPAGRQAARSRTLIDADREQKGSRDGTHRSPIELALTIASTTRVLSSWNEMFRTPGSSPMR